MNFLIDTNVISEVRKGSRCDPRVSRWYESVGDSNLYLSVLVIGEIRKGVERRRPQDAAQARALEKWLKAVVADYSDRILPVDRAVAEEWGRMNAARPLPVIDGLLAATAKVHGMTLATRDSGDLTGTGVSLLDPFAQ